MRDNPLQFAVVREDPRIEEEVIRIAGARRVLLIGSGGCTALALQSLFPELEITLLDPNPAQLDHVRRKVDALGAAPRPVEAFNVGATDPRGLSECGNFESLFRGLRGLIHDLVAPRAAWERAFAERDVTFVRGLESTRYWSAAFDLYFSDRFLNAMFGPDATQHAAPGSYAEYFRRRFERGLADPRMAENHFLHHVFLGHYLPRPECLPRHLSHPPMRCRFHYSNGDLHDVPRLDSFDLIHLSNIFDWMDAESIARVTRTLRDGMRRGAWVTLRQLNNVTDYGSEFGEAFRFDADLAARLLEEDRSLFYERLSIGRRE